MSTVPGARFSQTQPVSAFSIGGQGPGASPVTLLTVPAGKTYRLWGVHMSLSAGTLTGFTSVSGVGVNAWITDGVNIYIDVETFFTASAQNSTASNVVDCRGAVLAAGTVVTMVMGTVAANVAARMGGGAIWSPS